VSTTITRKHLTIADQCQELGNARLAAPRRGRDAAGLARQFARLPQSTVVQPPTPTEAFGHDALHLRLRIDDSCPSDQVYRVAETSKGYRGISYSNVPKEVVIDFWVVDLDGTAVVVDLWHQGDASTELVDRATRARDSISFVKPE
jgi:hypothetical protein